MIMGAPSFFSDGKKQAMKVRRAAAPLEPAELVELRALLRRVRKGEVLPQDMDAGEVAKALGLKRRAVLDAVREGEFPGAYKPAPNRVRIPVAAVLAFREKREVTPAGGRPA